MQEELITYETAVLAKEKGFSEICQYLYVTLKGREGKLLPELSGTFEKPNRILAPTQSLLQRWLRDVHDIRVCVDPYNSFQIGLGSTNSLRMGEGVGIVQLGETFMEMSSKEYETYEQALEVGLVKALKLIK